MSVGHVFDDDGSFDPFAEEHKKGDVERVYVMMREIRKDELCRTSDTLFYGARNMLYLAYSPIAGPIITSLYGLGILMGLVAPTDMTLNDLLSEGEYGSFDRRAGDLNRLSKGYFDEKREVVSQAERREHAIVSKCATVCTFGGCFGNSLLSRYRSKELPKAYVTKANIPFFLLGALGIALTQYSLSYKTQRNVALLKETEYVVSRLIE